MQFRHFWPLILCFLSQPCLPACEDEIAVYYANGMFNDEADADEALKAFKKLTTSTYPERTKRVAKWDVAYNTNERVLKQLWQVFDQKRSEVVGNFWASMMSLMAKSESAKKEVIDILKRTGEKQLKKDADLRTQVDAYLADLKKKMGVVTVAHSQGNFYSIFAFENIPEEHMDRMNIVAVATPASHAHKDRYTTFYSDGVIVPIPDSLAPNAKKTNPGPFDHSFVGAYLTPGDGKAMILDNFERAFADSLPANTTAGYLMTDWSSDEIRLHSSLDPMLKWIRDYYKKPYPLEPYQCFAVLVVMDINSFGDTVCEDKNLELAEKIMDECAEDIRYFAGESKSPRKSTLCSFGGLGWRTQTTPAQSEEDIRRLNPQCGLPTFGSMENRVGLQGIVKAKAFLRSLSKTN